jgi:hypothetical protein
MLLMQTVQRSSCIRHQSLPRWKLCRLNEWLQLPCRVLWAELVVHCCLPSVRILRPQSISIKSMPRRKHDRYSEVLLYCWILRERVGLRAVSEV